MFVCNRIEDPQQRSAPVLAAMKTLPADQQTLLLSTLGRIGGSAVEAMARQPEISGTINNTMIVAAALIEGAALFAVVVGLLAVL